MKYLLFVYSLLLSFSVFAETHELKITYTVNKIFYSELSEEKKIQLNLRISEIQNFISNKLTPEVPLQILPENFSIKIFLDNKAQRDGLYQTNTETGVHEISINANQIYSHGVFSLIAHELFHAIHASLKPNESTWMREGLAQLFEYYATGEFNGRNLNDFQQSPFVDFFKPYEIESTSRNLYGLHLMYFYYLTEQCGGKKTFWQITTAMNGQNQNLSGIDLIDSVLSKVSSKNFQCKNFNNSLMFFEIAKHHNNTQYLAKNSPNTFFLTSLNLKLNYPAFKSNSEFQIFMKMLPLFSSIKVSMAKVQEFKLYCLNCQITYSERTFPYKLTTQEPKDTKNIDVIFVKIESK